MIHSPTAPCLLPAFLGLLLAGAAATLYAQESPAEPMYLALYDVSDLLGASRSGMGLDGEGPTDEAVLQQELWGELGSLVGDPQTRLSGRFGSILLTGTTAAHQRVHEFLDGLRQRRSALFRYQVTVARYSPGLLDQVAEAGSARRVDVGGRVGFILDEAQLSALQTAIDGGNDASLVERIVLACAAGDSTGWHRKLETSIVQDAVIQILRADAFTDPQVGAVWHGYELGLTPLAEPGRTDLTLHVRSLERIEEIRTPAGPIQVPVQLTQEVKAARLQLPGTGALLLAGLADPFPMRAGGRRGKVSRHNLMVCIRALPGAPALARAPAPSWLTDGAALATRLVPREATEGEPSLTLFDVRDLVEGIQDFGAPELGLGAEETPDEPEVASSGDGAKDLAAWIRENVAPHTWSGAGLSIQATSGNLVLRQRGAILSLIEEVLADLRGGSGQLLMLEVTFLRIATQRGVAVTQEGLVLGNVTHAWGGVVEREAILGGVKANEGIEVVSAPRITVLPSQRASILIANQTAYVSDFDITVASEDAGGPTLIGDPVIDTLQTGLALECRGLPLAGAEEILLEIELQQSDSDSPIAALSFSPSGGASVEIQTPSVRSTSVRTALRIPAGKTVLLASPALAADGESPGQAILVTASFVDVEGK